MVGDWPMMRGKDPVSDFQMPPEIGVHVEVPPRNIDADDKKSSQHCRERKNLFHNRHGSARRPFGEYLLPPGRSASGGGLLLRRRIHLHCVEFAHHFPSLNVWLARASACLPGNPLDYCSKPSRCERRKCPP